MTWRSFLRDLQYGVLLGGGFLVKFAAGWLALNYLLVGTELHRTHHGADARR